MRPKRTDVTGAIAALIATLTLITAVPQAALAQGQGVWNQWVEQVADRETVAEIPFAVLFTIPAMIVITPIWLTQLAMKKIRGDDD